MKCAAQQSHGSRTLQKAHSYRRSITLTFKGRYLLHLPAQASDAGGRLPLILFLHGAGERGNDLDLVKRHGPPSFLDGMPSFPFIVASPQCPAGQWWNTDHLVAFLDHVLAKHPVDPSRVYLTGLSMGGFGTWHLACRCPERFAAIAPICGGGNAFEAWRLKDVPVWAFHGNRDSIVPVRETRNMITRIREAGGNPKITIYRGVDHDSWTQTYASLKLYEWFLQHRVGRKGRTATTT